MASHGQDRAPQPTGLSEQLARALSDGVHSRSLLLGSVVLSGLTIAALTVSVVLQRAGMAVAHALLAVPIAALAIAATIAIARASRQVVAHDSRHRSTLRSADAIFETLAEGVAVIGPDGRVVACNRSAAAIVGVPVETIVGQSFESPAICFLRNDGALLDRKDHPVHVTLASGESCRDVVVGVQMADQHLLWLALSTVMMRQADSPWDGYVVCTFTDVSERRQDQLALMARESQLRQTLTGAPLILWSADSHGRLDLVLGGGLPAPSRDADLIERPAGELFPDCPSFAQALEQARGGEPAETRSSLGDRVFETRVSPDLDSGGHVVGVSGISVDVTARVRAETEQGILRDALRRAAQEWRATFDTIESPVLLVGADARVRRVNRAAQGLWGEPFSAIVHAPLPAPEHGAPWGAIGEAVRRCQARGALVAVDESGTDGKRHWDVVAAPLRGESEVAEGVVIVARDVSRIVALQESLRRSEHMSVLGQLVGGVAHQVRNPLFGISSTLDAFDVEFEGRDDLAEYSRLLRHETGRLSRLMNDLLEYGKPAPVSLSPGSLQDVLESALRATASLARSARVTVKMTVPDPLPQILVEPQRLEEALRNLIENAIQVSSPGTEVHVWVRVDERTPGGTRVSCGVEDSGPGFRQEDLPRLFEPFFSRRSGGTGLGLSIAQRIVEEHMGTIVATNLDRGGALVTIDLPVATSTGPQGEPRG